MDIEELRRRISHYGIGRYDSWLISPDENARLLLRDGMVPTTRRIPPPGCLVVSQYATMPCVDSNRKGIILWSVTELEGDLQRLLRDEMSETANFITSNLDSAEILWSDDNIMAVGTIERHVVLAIADGVLRAHLQPLGGGSIACTHSNADIFARLVTSHMEEAT